ncbi:MAG: TldD/PmbA family protein [Bacteroidales bacterium]|nr:TldD/PmbA family protein [Bacteroidales bacterium]
MKPITRRKFLRNTACAGSLLVIPPYLDGSVFTLNNLTQEGYFEKEFGITDQLCQEILNMALSKGGDFADIYFEHTLENTLVLEDGKVSRSYGNIKLGVGIRTVNGDQVGYGYTQELTKESMLSAAKTASTIANGIPKPFATKFKVPDIGNYYPINSSFEEIPISEKLIPLKAVNENCFSKSKNIIKATVVLYDNIKRIMVITSDGIKAEDTIPCTYMYAGTTAEKNNKKEQAWSSRGGNYDFSFYTNKVSQTISDEVVKRTLTMFDTIQPPAGEMPVVLGPGITGILLHEAIGHGMEADFNRKNTSTYSNMMGKKVAPSNVTIIDDATNLHQQGSLNFDDEGVPGQKTILVENGILKSYMHDKISAKHYGVQPTGNGRRESFEHYPIPRMRNTYMLGGNELPKDVIKKAQNGIYIENVRNGQVKIGEGDFSFYVSQGRLIENGKLTAPIKDVNIMGNGPKMLENIDAIANDLEFFQGGPGGCGKGQFVRVSFGMPTCLVKSMTVGGTQQKGGAS